MGPISIVESRWWKTGNHSVRALFEAVAAIHYDNPHAFYYDMFADATSLKTVLTQRASDTTTQVIYLASHGNDTEIGPTANNAVSRTEFRNILNKTNGAGTIRGLFLGTCLTGNADMAKFLLEHPNSSLDWVAGYSKTVDWVDGSAIDMIFFSKLAALYVENKSKKKGKLDAKSMAHCAASRLIELVPGAYNTYAFNIYFAENKKMSSMFK